MNLEKKIIQSYGLLSANSFYCRPETEEQVSECITYAKKKGLKICPHGGGMSFSDVGLIDDNISLDIRGLNQIIKFDSENGILIAQAGVLTTDILSLTMPFGWYLCGLSGSLRNTLAGDISNNINGKDSWKHGNFGANVKSMKIFLADEVLQEVDSVQHTALFNAIIGGLGLLGVIVEVTLQLIKIPSYVIENRSERLPNFNLLMSKMNSLNENESSFFYAWTDAFSKSKSFGRCITETARFVQNEKNISTNEFKRGLIEKNKIGFLSPEIFWKLFSSVESQTAFRVANAIKYYSAFDKRAKQKVFPEYQYPMVKYFPRWNLKYVPNGFHEFQLLFLEDNFGDVFHKIIEICRQYHCLPQICSIRKHKKDPYYLSFSETGYSFTVNYPLKTLTPQAMHEFNRKLIDAVLQYKGKIYIGKFSYISPEECREMYPLYDRFLQIKNLVDPNRLFSSNAAQRLFA